MRFADPLYFGLLLLLIPLIMWGRKAGGRILYSNIETLKNLKQGRKLHPRVWLMALRVLALVLIIAALARPQSGKRFSEVLSEGVDIFLALDTSGSMAALDFKLENKPVTRLDAVKNVVKEFIKKRPSDRLGIVVFGEEAFTQCPLTLDHGVVMAFLEDLKIGMAGDATAIGSAVGTAVNRMKDLKSKSKIIILLTDGLNTAGRIAPAKAAELAKTYSIKTYTVGVGGKGKAPFLVNTPFGKRYQYQHVPLDEKSLRGIASTTDAKYYHASDTENLKRIYEEIDKLETTEVKLKEYTEYYELFHWFLIPGLLLLLLEVVLSQTRLRKIP